MRISNYLILLSLLFLMGSCKEDPPAPPGEGPYVPTPVTLEVPPFFPKPNIPSDNPLTVEGINLGRMLFYDPILSKDSSISCASCHNPQLGFKDDLKISPGVNQALGTRKTQQIINVAWANTFFWDGRASSLEQQAEGPIIAVHEMASEWPIIFERLKRSPIYSNEFKKVFGTDNITSTHIVKAISQFQRTFISAQSKHDLNRQGLVPLTPSERRGELIFMTEKGDCFHCHNPPLFTDNLFHNIGMDTEFQDKGRFNHTGDPNDIGLFKTPTLRNVAVSGPYMHDGRFNTLEEVIDHYSEGLVSSPTIDPLMKNVHQGGVRLNPQEKADLIAFLRTLTDTTFLNKPELQNPFTK